MARIVLITGTTKNRSADVVSKLVKRVTSLDWKILTSNNEGVEAEVIRQVDGLKYNKLVVISQAVSGGGYISAFGINYPVKYGQEQIDSVLVSRSDLCLIVGQDERTRKMVDFACTLGKTVKQFKETF